MNKHLNNWLDKVEGLPPETSNNNIYKEMKRQGYKIEMRENDVWCAEHRGWVRPEEATGKPNHEGLLRFTCNKCNNQK